MLRLLAAASLISALALVAPAAQAAPADARAILGDIRKAATARDGIDDAGFVTIGGIRQWVSVRGRHKDAPILLFVHGGPGFTSIPSSWFAMQGWDEYFTIAQWDQRGAGKTYAANPPEAVAPTMTKERMLADAEEVVGHLRQTYGRRKIVLMGHSWGSILGMMLAQKHPDWFYAYVGMGQAIDFPRNEALGYQATLAAARADRNETAVRELEALAPFPDPANPARNLQNLETERKWLAHYGGAVWTGSESGFGHLGRISPDYSDADNAARDDGLGFSLTALWSAVGSTDFSRLNRLDLPVVFLHGRHDTNVSATLLGEWFGRLHAPSKKLVWFEDSAHVPFEEEPGKTLVTLVQDVLPLTRPGA